MHSFFSDLAVTLLSNKRIDSICNQSILFSLFQEYLEGDFFIPSGISVIEWVWGRIIIDCVIFKERYCFIIWNTSTDASMGRFVNDLKEFRYEGGSFNFVLWDSLDLNGVNKSC